MLEDNKRLMAKIDGRAPDLFKARKGKPQLEWKGYLSKKQKEGKETRWIKKDGDIENTFDLKALRHVG